MQETTGGRQSRKRGLSGPYKLCSLYSDVCGQRRLSIREQSEQESVLSARGRSIGLARRLGEGGIDEIGFARARRGYCNVCKGHNNDMKVVIWMRKRREGKSSCYDRRLLKIDLRRYNRDEKSIDSLVKRSIVQRPRALGGCRFDSKGEYKRSLLKES